MGISKIKKSFTVWLKKEYENFEKGSCLHVEKESEKFYFGIHASMGGSFNAKFPKAICRKTDPSSLAVMQRKLKKATPEVKDAIKKLELEFVEKMKEFNKNRTRV